MTSDLYCTGLKLVGRVLPLAFLLFGYAGSVSAEAITVGFELGTINQYNYVTGKNEDPVLTGPLEGSFTFENNIRYARDHGEESITAFGSPNGTEWDSPFYHLVRGTNPFGDNAGFSTSYTFPNINDYAGSFIEQAAAQGNAYHASGDKFWAHHVEVRVTKRLPSRGGDGDEDYFFTPSTHLDFLRELQADGTDLYFNHSWQMFNQDTDEYLAGYSWSSYDGRITTVQSTVVSEPPTLTIALLGLLAYFGYRSRAPVSP